MDAAEVTWLTAAELSVDKPWLPRDYPENDVHRTLKALFATVDLVSSQFGADRVRLVFAFV